MFGFVINNLCARVFVLLMLCSVVAVPVKAVQIETSIKPLALLLEPLLLPGDSINSVVVAGASPHDYALKVSEIQRLHHADLVVWIGPELERFLQKPIASLEADKVMQLSQLPAIVWPHLESEELALSDLDGDHHDHDHGDQDPHLWLNPRNAIVVATYVSQRLAEINPAEQQAYANRLADYVVQLQQYDSELEQQLQPLQGQGFVVYHRGYDHFVSRYQLKQLGYITLTPEQKPGARHLYQLRKTLAGKAQCIFIEPGREQGAAESLARDLNLQSAQVDPLGSEAGSYIELLAAMTQAFVECLPAIAHQ